MSSDVDHLEREVEEARARLELTIDAIQERLSISAMAEELASSLRAAEFGPVVNMAIAAARRNPIPVMLAVLGIGWLIHRMSRDSARSRGPYGGIESEDTPVLSTGNARGYDPRRRPGAPAGTRAKAGATRVPGPDPFRGTASNEEM